MSLGPILISGCLAGNKACFCEISAGAVRVSHRGKNGPIPVLETKTYTDERLPVLGRSRDSGIDPAIQNDVIADGVG